MPQLDEITYSRDVCVAAIRDYYQFLTKLYLNPSDVISPPPEGWPSITASTLEELDKTEEVISLLRHLPYISEPPSYRSKSQAIPYCYFADWQELAGQIRDGGTEAEGVRIMTEMFLPDEDMVPPHVVGLTFGGRDNTIFLLDTELGVVYWVQCPADIGRHDEFWYERQVHDDAEDHAPENEAAWRGDSPAWPVADFFELLKDQYRKLRFLPLSSRTVIDVWSRLGPGTEGLIPMVRDIYREHAWPDLEGYRKRECLEAVQAGLRERYPRHADRPEEGGEDESE
ncbi:hypothetical protein B0T25DRAFT_69661 [Lasiosphaeria hispida]|uniref:Uncharacterized protein n=1 Tax=Lasiosphaeria hispida TaxID=260671 RepID=A0AAJ0HXP7_9PEZI|nr:hypothetical protein B0T25DRAFT_69661 [Lasiosphaeria hispida]